MKSIAIHQPNYIPWLGYFYKIYQCDVFVFLDDVQYSNQGLHNYHFIKTQNGPMRMKIPVVQSLGDKINVVKMRSELDWKKKHLDLIKTNYAKAPYFSEVYADFSNILANPYEYLTDLNIALIEMICTKLGIRYEFIRSSVMNIQSTREEKVIDICKSLHGDIYYSGTGARVYQVEDDFTKNGLQLKYSEYKVFEYPQQFEGFQSNVTILDFLMNCGYNWELVLENQL